MPELPLVVTVDDAKNPILLVRILRAISDQISSIGTRLESLTKNIKVPSTAYLRNSLQSNGDFPLNITNLRGIVADPQPASALRYNTAPTGLVLQNLRDTQFVLVQNGTGYDLCTVIGGNPNSLFTLISGASGGTFMTTDTVQTVTGAKTFNVGKLILATSGGANQVLQQTSSGGPVTVGTLDAASIAAGKLALARGGTNADLSATGGTSKFLKQVSSGAAITVVQPAAADLSDYTEWTPFTPTLTADSGTFSGTVTTAKYKIVGKSMTIAFVLAGCTVSATPASLFIAVPAGKTVVGITTMSMPYLDNGVVGTGCVGVNSGASSTTIKLFKDLSGAAWATSVASSTFRAIVEFEIA